MSPPLVEPPTGGFVPRRLVVIGAAAGMGLWLAHHLFPQIAWDDAFLIDTQESADLLASREWRLGCPTTIGYLDPVDGSLRGRGGERLTVDVDGLVVCLAVPRTSLSTVVRDLVTPGGVAHLVLVAPNMGQALATVEEHVPGRDLVAIHPLFDSSARSLEGHTVYLARSGDPDSTWLADAVRRAGGSLKVGAAAEHDRAMAYVQAAAHQALLAFADTVTRSGLDLAQDLWAARTPLFESLFGLATRVLDERAEAGVVDIQQALGGPAVAQETAASLERLASAVSAGPEAVTRFIDDVRERFSGTLFETVRGTAAVAVNAAQSKATELAHRRRTGELVGLRSVGGEGLRVGRIVELGPTDVTFVELLVGDPGRAVLLEGPGAPNARKLGVNRRPRETRFSLGHVDVVIGDELDAWLDRSLAFVQRDVRFLVPESVAGSGVLSVVAPTHGVRDCAVVSEVVRTGQRAVVVRMGIRADNDVEEMVELLRERVQRAYAWSPGISRPALGEGFAVAYLGPAGTFSEDAARQSTIAVGVRAAEFRAMADFGEVLAAVGPATLAVLPLTSSSSGLVSRSVSALLAHEGPLVAGGVADVAVRFDAYVPAGARLDELRGGTVYSHPQALAQCSAFVRRWGLTPVPTPSTYEAVAMLAAGDIVGVALAGSGRAAADPRLKVAEREVDDLSGSVTRFLIVGAPEAFGAFVGGSDPTLRSIVIGEGPVPTVGTDGLPSYDEVLRDAAGRWLWVSSGEPEAVPGSRHLGRVPWSPRTPVVRVSADG